MEVMKQERERRVVDSLGYHGKVRELHYQG